MAAVADKVRVLFFFRRSLLGGTEVAISRMISELDRTQFWIGILTVEGFGPLHAQCVDVPIDLREALGLQGSIGGLGSGFAELMRLTRQHEIEVIYSFGVVPTLMSLVSRQLQGWPRYVICGQRGGFPKRNLRCLLRALLANRCDAIVFNSRTAFAQATRLCRFSSSKSIVIPNGFQPPVLSAVQVARTAQMLTSITGSGRIIVGMVANICVPKDYPTLLHAAKDLLTRIDHLAFVSIGRDVLNGSVQALAAELEISSSFHFLGALTAEDTLSVMRLFDIFVLSSRSEGLPNSIVEAMALGKPVIASDVGGVRELVEHGRTGFLFSSGNSEQLSGYLSALICDSTLRQQMGGAGAMKVQQEFSLAESAKKTSELLTVFTGRKGSKHGLV